MKQRFGRFEVVRPLGEGFMGKVYLAKDPVIGREVAIKVIKSDSSHPQDQSIRRFEREAKAAGVLNHQNIVTIFDFGMEKKDDKVEFFIVMEYINGESLLELFEKKELSRRESLEVLAQICDGLECAHQAKIIHRDIKPANVMVKRQGTLLNAKVTDFGVARTEDSSMTTIGLVLGSTAYMAPEYISTGMPDTRSDLFAIGVMLYESLAGEKPFTGNTPQTIMYRIMQEEPAPINTDSFSDISPHVRQILQKALQKDPNNRYQTANELAKDLRAAKEPAWKPQYTQQPNAQNPETETYDHDKTKRSLAENRYSQRQATHGHKGEVIAEKIYKDKPVPAQKNTKENTEQDVSEKKKMSFVLTKKDDLVLISGGTFTMGSPASEAERGDNEIQHQVTVSSFYMGKYQVTQAEYLELMGENPSHFKGDNNRPVERVTWVDATRYCNRLSEREGLTPAYTINGEDVTWNRSANGYRLPTEAEWEYACRAGEPTPFSTGYNITTDQANYNGNYPYNNNVKGRYREQTTPVGSFAPNPWGLYDMHGNVWEWCWDWYGEYSVAPQTDPVGAVSGIARVLRGGGWSGTRHRVRSARRDYTYPSLRNDSVGFRVGRPQG